MYKARLLSCAAGSGWHKAGPDQQLPPHVAWNQVTDAERQALDGSASAENISRGQQRGPVRTHSYNLPQGNAVLHHDAFLCYSFLADSMPQVNANAVYRDDALAPTK